MLNVAFRYQHALRLVYFGHMTSDFQH